MAAILSNDLYVLSKMHRMIYIVRDRYKAHKGLLV